MMKKNRLQKNPLELSFTQLDITSLGRLELSWTSMSYRLHTLDVSSNKLTTLLLRPDLPLPSMPALRNLNVSKNQLSSLSFALRSFPNLEYLDLSHNRLIKIGGIKCLTGLVRLSLRRNRLGDESLVALRGLQTLRSLDLAENRISNFSCLSVLTMPLRQLWLNGNPVTKREGYLVALFSTTHNVGLQQLDGLPVPKSARENGNNKMIRSPHQGQNFDRIVLDTTSNSSPSFKSEEDLSETTKEANVSTTKATKTKKNNNSIWKGKNAMDSMRTLAIAAQNSSFADYSLRITKAKLKRVIDASNEMRGLAKESSNSPKTDKEKNRNRDESLQSIPGYALHSLNLSRVSTSSESPSSQRSFTRIENTDMSDYSLRETERKLRHAVQCNDELEEMLNKSKGEASHRRKGHLDRKRHHQPRISMLGFPLPHRDKEKKTFDEKRASTLEEKEESSRWKNGKDHRAKIEPHRPISTGTRFAALSSLSQNQHSILKSWMKTMSSFEDLCIETLLRLIRCAGVSGADGTSQYAKTGFNLKFPAEILKPIRHTPAIIRMARTNQVVAAAVAGIARRITKLQNALAKLRNLMTSPVHTIAEINRFRAALLSDEILKRKFSDHPIFVRLGQVAELQAWRQQYGKMTRKKKLRKKWNEMNGNFEESDDNETTLFDQYDCASFSGSENESDDFSCESKPTSFAELLTRGRLYLAESSSLHKKYKGVEVDVDVSNNSEITDDGDSVKEQTAQKALRTPAKEEQEKEENIEKETEKREALPPLPPEMVTASLFQRVQSGIIKVQSAKRGRDVRHHNRLRHKASEKIQSLARGAKVRSGIQKKLEEVLHAEFELDQMDNESSTSSIYSVKTSEKYYDDLEYFDF
eukprot:g3067.t1